MGTLENSNVLEGMACPQCGSRGPFRIEVRMVATLDDEGGTADGDMDWSEGNWAKCVACNFTGTAGDLYIVEPLRVAVIAAGDRAPRLETVQRYLPRNYSATAMPDGSIRIEGRDYHGWDLLNYVIPRLASGLIHAEEVHE